VNPRSFPFGGVVLALAAAWPGFVRGDPAAPNRVVELPPLMVSEGRNPLAWHYGEAPGGEILSVCPDDTTREFIRQFYRLRQLLALVLPPRLQMEQSMPMVHLLAPTNMGDRLKQDVQVEMFHGQGTAAAADEDAPLVGRGGSPPQIHVLPNLRLMDTDAYTIFALLDDEEVSQGHLSLTGDYVAFLLQRRVPPLPPWFVVGTLHLFDSLTFGTRDVEIAPDAGLTRQQIAAIRKDPAAAAAALLPMEDILAGPRPPVGPPAAVEAYRQAWIAQSALFARWALDGRSVAEREAYFKFVERASSAPPVTADLVRESFGLSPAEIRARLGRYLPAAIAKTMRLRLTGPEEGPVLKLRPATAAEIARIKGDWERMETSFVKTTYPALSENYLEQARRTLHRAYDLGERDPRLLAALGLTECDAGNDAAALPFLAAATGARVVRPRAYYELARILYARERARPAGAKGRLSAAQTTAIVEPLLAAQHQSPPLPAACALFSELWFHSDLTPLPSDLVQLNAGAGYFPRNFSLVYQAALLDAQAGDWPAARRQVEQGKTAATSAVRGLFEHLQGLLPPTAPPAG
jgi:hypothetical protein